MEGPAAASVVRMESVIPNLYATSAEPLPFAPAESVRAFLLRRDQGNLLVYSAPAAAAEASAIEQLGGVSRQYLNHWHEAAFGGLEQVVPAIGAPVFAHEEEREHVAEVSAVETFSARAALGDDFELIPIPGHTPGATAFLWNSGDHRVLFTGDSVYLRDGEWVAAVLGSSDRAAYAESLELMRELDFDVLVPWVASNDGPFHALTSRADARRRIDAILARVRAGAES
jgi:glyoxylase-like metal-dependent hydrolase (beta-lactamase superfamily II)